MVYGFWPSARTISCQHNKQGSAHSQSSPRLSRIITSSAKTYLLVKQRSHCQIYFYREWFNKSRLQTSVNLCHGSRRMSGSGLVRASFYVSQFEHKTKKVFPRTPGSRSVSTPSLSIQTSHIHIQQTLNISCCHHCMLY